MSTQVEINGVTFLPIKEAAKVVSYSRDYVARLARDQKVVATQVGRQWFVDAISLQNFAEVAELELSIRKQQLSSERKREQVIKQEVKNVRTEIKSKVKSVRMRAQVAAAFVLGFGLLSGAGLYTTSILFPSQTSSLARLNAASQARLAPVNKATSVVSPSEVALPEASPQATALFTAISESPLFVDEAETRAMSASSSEGIFLLSADHEVRDVEAIKALFSDDVSVEFVDESTGVITYTRSEGKTASFPFVSVPTKKVTGNEGTL
jgi:hypothetical protein